MKDNLWNKYHEAETNDLLEDGIYDFTVDRIVELADDSIVLAFNVAGHGIAQRIYFDGDKCTKAKYLLASVGLLKNIRDAWITNELANTVGKSGRCLVGQYNNGSGNNIEFFMAPWSDELDFLWKHDVIKRAGGRCEACGAPGTVAHHPRPKSKFPEERYDVSNGQCLCWSCHNKWHDTYGTMAIGGPGR